QNIQNSPEAQAYKDKKNQPTPPTDNPAPAPPPPAASAPPGNQTPPDIYGSPLTAPFPGTFTPPAPVSLGGPLGLPNVPTFTGDQAPPQFAAPSVADALNDPGYQFRTQQGDQGLQNWAAARGTLNDSSTAKSLSDYNQ